MSSNETRYYDVLKQITKYQSVERLRKHSGADWGLPYEEALEYAYENIVWAARSAIKGKRRPHASKNLAGVVADPPT